MPLQKCKTCYVNIHWDFRLSPERLCNTVVPHLSSQCSQLGFYWEVRSEWIWGNVSNNLPLISCASFVCCGILVLFQQKLYSNHKTSQKLLRLLLLNTRFVRLEQKAAGQETGAGCYKLLAPFRKGEVSSMHLTSSTSVMQPHESV